MIHITRWAVMWIAACASLSYAILLCALPPTPAPEKSIRDAYLRMTFILNLNPVPWEQVRDDVVFVSTRLRDVDSAGADSLLVVFNHIVAAATRPPPAVPDDDLPVNPELAEEDSKLPRVEGARQLFTAVTRAVGAIAVRNLSGLERAAKPKELVERAREAFAAFEPTLRFADPLACEKLVHAFNDLQQLTTTDHQTGAAVDSRDRLGAHCNVILTYLSQNFGEGYSAGSDRSLAPWPLASATFDRSVRPPTLLPPGSTITKPLPRPRQLLNNVERGADERETPLITFGAAAFNSPVLFGEPARSLGISCNSCHNKTGVNPGFVIPGLSARPGGVDVTNSFFSAHANNGVFDPVDIPDLRGIRFTAPYGRNGRFASLREFVRNVIVNEFNGNEPDPTVLDAMIAYMNEFDFVDNPALNRDGSLNERGSVEARRGETLFRKSFAQFGNESCASCHVPSANFIDHRRHDIGSVKGAASFSRDRALDTPTLLGTVFSPPYFHDGSLPTLQSVVEWFDREYKLALTPGEVRDLTSYLHAVGNGVHAFEPGAEFLSEDMEDQESFLAAAEFLMDKGKWPLVEDLFNGIGREIQSQQLFPRTPAIHSALDDFAVLTASAAAAAKSAQRPEVEQAINRWRERYRRCKADFERFSYPPPADQTKRP